MKGRKPRPTALHDLHGNPSKFTKADMRARIASEPAISSPKRLPAPPEFTPEQREVWDNAVANAPTGILHTIDEGILRVWVAAYCMHRDAMIQQSRTSLLVRPSNDPANQSLPVQSPLLAVINRQGVMMLRAAEQLGFTPTARPRIFANAPPPLAPSAAHTGDGPPADGMRLETFLASAPPRPRMN